jgi:hypothetical protein
MSIVLELFQHNILILFFNPRQVICGLRWWTEVGVWRAWSWDAWSGMMIGGKMRKCGSLVESLEAMHSYVYKILDWCDFNKLQIVIMN